MQSHPNHACLRWSVLLMLAGCAFKASASDRYSTVHNEGNETIRSIQVKQQGSDRWTDVDVGEGIARGTSKKLHIRSQGRGRCLYDIRTTFESTPVLLHEQMDLCAVWTYTPNRYRQFGIRQAMHSKTTRPVQPALASLAGEPTLWSQR
jgi:hypothetical protein